MTFWSGEAKREGMRRSMEVARVRESLAGMADTMSQLIERLKEVQASLLEIEGETDDDDAPA